MYGTFKSIQNTVSYEASTSGFGLSLYAAQIVVLLKSTSMFRFLHATLSPENSIVWILQMIKAMIDMLRYNLYLYTKRKAPILLATVRAVENTNQIAMIISILFVILISLLIDIVIFIRIRILFLEVSSVMGQPDSCWYHSVPSLTYSDSLQWFRKYFEALQEVEIMPLELWRSRRHR